MAEYSTYLISAGALVIASLSFYAGRLIWLLREQRAKQAEAANQHKQNLNAHDAKVLNSILIIVKAMQEEQCDYSEGCWRLSVLLDSLKTTSGMASEFPAIFKLYNGIKDMQILEERKQLAKKERMRQDVERIKLETALYDEINKDLGLLMQYTQERISVLKPAN